MKLSYPKSSILKTVEKTNQEPLRSTSSGALFISNEDFTNIADTKTQQNQDFTEHPKPRSKPN
jgi:hypothetical protein